MGAAQADEAVTAHPSRSSAALDLQYPYWPKEAGPAEVEV